MPANDYGPAGRTALQVATASGWCTQESFAAYLSAVLRHPVSRGQVANWASGRDHVPADILVHLARHTGRPMEVMQVLLGEVDLLAVERPRGVAAGGEVVVLAASTAGRVGRLVEHVVLEADEGSDGGRARTPAELRARLSLIHGAQVELAQLHAETLATIHGAPVAFPRPVVRAQS